MREGLLAGCGLGVGCVPVSMTRGGRQDWIQYDKENKDLPGTWGIGSQGVGVEANMNRKKMSDL